MIHILMIKGNVQHNGGTHETSWLLQNIKQVLGRGFVLSEQLNTLHEEHRGPIIKLKLFKLLFRGSFQGRPMVDVMLFE